MEMPKNISTILWSAAGGAAAAMIVGFSWGGWVTGGSARTAQTSASHDAVVVALAPICADRFRAQSDSATKIAELAKSSSWDRGNVVAKSGYATMPGSKDPDSDVARACGEMLANPATPTPTPKT
jgi:alpha/beta superfamily hydrolase